MTILMGNRFITVSLMAATFCQGQQSAQNKQGDYQQYMKQYAGNYMQGQAGSSSGGFDYQQYTQQYAGQYMQGGQTGSSSGATQGGDYQQYMKQYAGNYMQGGQTGSSKETSRQTPQQQGFDYQQYTKQYAGQYMQGGQSGSSSGGKQGGDYQQYMKQYAGKYMQPGSSNGSQQGGDYQQYMKQYAGQYMQGHKNGSHATSQQGGDYQQYMKQYAGQYMKGHQNDSHVRSQQSSQATAALPREDFQKHQHQQGGPSEYQHDVAIANNSHLLSKHVAADQHTLPEFRSHNLSEAARNQSGNLRGSSPAAMRLASSEAFSSHTHQISMRFLAIVVPTFIAVSLFAVRRRRINSQVEEDCYYVEVDGDNSRAGEYQAPHLTS